MIGSSTKILALSKKWGKGKSEGAEKKGGEEKSRANGGAAAPGSPRMGALTPLTLKKLGVCRYTP